MPKSKKAAAKAPKRTRGTRSRDGALTEEALEQVSGGAGVATAEADGQVNAQQQDAMSAQQAQFEAASKMSAFAFALGKSVRDKWPAGR